MSLLSLLRRALGWPARRLLDPRTRWTHDLIDERLGYRPGQPDVHYRLDRIEGRLEALVRHAGWRRAAISGSTAPELTLEDLTPELAEFLNWNDGPHGLAAQAGMWFNPPVPPEYLAGAVRPLHVTERIAEQPFAFASLAELAPGSRVLDVGGSESHVGLALASSGYRVTLVDPRGSPFTHPNLDVCACRLEDLPGGDPYDGALALSAIEHFGLGHYLPAGTDPETERADLAAMALLAERTRSGGLLVLTVPYGPPSTDDFQRVYDADGLEELLAGWNVRRRRFAHTLDRLTWLTTDEWPGGDEPGAALVLAERP